MTFMAIIAFIMQILNFILGIFVPPAPTGVAQAQFSCEKLVWTQPLKMVSGELVGTVQETCKFEGASGGGLVQLKEHLVRQVERDASTIYAGPVQTVSNGENATTYSVAFKGDPQDGDVETRGNSVLYTSANRLRHTFNQTAVYANNDAKYISGVTASMDVTPSTQAHWYNLTATVNIRVKKPWFVTAGFFANKIANGIEKQMPNRIIDAINELASHL